MRRNYKVSIIGSGNVGGLIALRIAESKMADTLLVDIKEGLALGKTLDLEDSLSVAGLDSKVEGTTDISKIKDSDVVVITAGFIRSANKTREELLKINAEIIRNISKDLKKYTPLAKVIVVTNPVDVLTYLLIRETEFLPKKVFGMGVSLDSARFSNLIAKELNISTKDINSTVIGPHGEKMIPLPRFTMIRGVCLDEFLEGDRIKDLVRGVIQRGAQIISLLGNQSAYFGPSQAILEIIKIIIKDEKRVVYLSSYLNGEYGVKDLCIGVPCRLGREGIEEIIELDLNEEEREAFLKSANYIKEQCNNTAI